MHFHQDDKNDDGFALIELIIVIAIIGILVALAIPLYGNVKHHARQNAIDSAAKDVAVYAYASIVDDDPATTVTSAVAEYNSTHPDVHIWAEFHTGEAYVDGEMRDGQRNFVILSKFEDPIQMDPYEYGKVEVHY